MAARKATAKVQGRRARPADTRRGDRRPSKPILGRAAKGSVTSGEIVGVGVVNLVKNTLATVLAGAQDVGTELGGAALATARGAIRAAYTIGADLGIVAREALRGTVTAAESIGTDLGGVTRSAARGAVKATGEVGGDVATVARRSVEGTAAAARELGLDVTSLARSAAEGAVEAADRIGTAAGRAVRTTLSGTVAGVRSLLTSRKPTPTARAAGKRTVRASSIRKASRSARRPSRGRTATGQAAKAS
jgi:hypothetical protein